MKRKINLPAPLLGLELWLGDDSHQIRTVLSKTLLVMEPDALPSVLVTLASSGLAFTPGSDEEPALDILRACLDSPGVTPGRDLLDALGAR